MDVNGYLRRFIDIEFILPEAKPRVFALHLFAQLGLRECFKKRSHATGNIVIDDSNELEIVFPKLCACFQLSLRDIEHCCRLFALVYMNIEANDFIYPYLSTTLVILKLLNDKLYRRYVSGHCNSEEVIKFILEQPRGENFLSTREGRHVDAYLFAASPKNWRDFAFYQMQLRSQRQELTQPEYLPERLSKMRQDDLEHLFQDYTHVINRQDNVTSAETLGSLSEKIELASLMLDYIE
jgi:hypothetical protein